MRLREMRERVKSLTAYQAESTTHHDDIDADLNDALEEVWVHKAWTFRERVTQLDVLPDIDGSGVIVTALNDGREVTGFDHPLLQPDRAQMAPLGRSWIGQTLHLFDRDFTILDIELAGGDDAIVTTEPVRLDSASLSSSTDEWTLRYTHLRLPSDCAEVLGLVDADTPLAGAPARGRVPGLPMRRAEDCDLRRDITGEPECYIIEPNLVVPPAGRTSVAWVSGGAPAASDDYGFTSSYHRFYELTWAYSVGGRIGPLAEPAIVEGFPAGTANAGRLVVSFLAEDEVTPAAADAPNYLYQPYPLFGEGLRKVLFVNSNFDPETGERKGIPCWRQVTRRRWLLPAEADSFPLEALDTATTAIIHQPDQVNAGNPRLYHDPDGTHLQIRLWPRPSSAVETYPEVSIISGRTGPRLELKRYLCRYMARPAKLCEPADTPPMPTEFHQVLVWKAVATMLARCHDPKMAAVYEKRATDKLEGLVNAHTQRQDHATVKGGEWNYQGGRMLPTNIIFTRDS